MTALTIDLGNYQNLDWSKRPDGLMPAIVQESVNKRVLMEGYVSGDTLKETLESGKIVFHSRTRGRWMKGETSGNFLMLAEGKEAIRCDCDRDALLILANPIGPTCHLGTISCFGDTDPKSVSDLAFLVQLEALIRQRSIELPKGSYTTKLFEAGIGKIAKKVGEEGVETALAAVSEGRDRLIEESADLIFHTMVLWRAASVEVSDVVDKLEERHAARPGREASPRPPIHPPP